MKQVEYFEGKWTREHKELVQRYEVKNMRKLDQVGISVPPNCVAMLFRHGELIETFQPGRVDLGALKPSWLGDLFGPKDRRVDIVFVYCGDTELECTWGTSSSGAVYSADKSACHVTSRLVVRPAEPQVLALASLEPGKDRLLTSDLVQLVVSRLTETIRSAAGQTELLGTTHFDTMRKSLEHALTDTTPEFWIDIGLRLQRVAQLDVTSSTAQKVLDAQAGLAGQSKGLDLTEEKKKLDRRRTQMSNLFDVMAQKDKDEKDTLLRELKKESMIGEREMELLNRQYGEEDQDYKLAREQFVAKTQTLNDQELDTLSTKYAQEKVLDGAQVQEKLADIKVKGQLERDLEKSKTEISIDMAEAEAGQSILEKVREGKRKDKQENLRMDREDDLERSAHKAKLIAELSQHGLATMMAGLEDSGRAQLVAELAKSENLGKMSEEQILAQAAGQSPEVARIFQEKFKGLAGDRIEGMYEKMHGDQQKFREELLSMFNMSATTQRDAAIGTAQGVGSASRGPVSGLASGTGTSSGVLVCSKCGQSNDFNTSNFCGNCGKKLKDV